MEPMRIGFKSLPCTTRCATSALFQCRALTMIKCAPGMHDTSKDNDIASSSFLCLSLLYSNSVCTVRQNHSIAAGKSLQHNFCHPSRNSPISVDITVAI